MLTDSSQVGEWGAPTLDVWVVRKDFAEQHPEIVKAFAKSAIDAQQPYIANPEAWLKQPDNISKLARLSGVPEADVPGLVKGNTYLTAAEQAAGAERAGQSGHRRYRALPERAGQSALRREPIIVSTLLTAL